jgi:aminomethyltransferase
MAPFGGWDMPIQYEGILAEHKWTRVKASIFDTCHMGEFELRGANAETDLERLITPSVAGIAIGQCRYGYLLRNDGGVLDDLTCYRRDKNHFWLIVNAGTCRGDAEWIRCRLSPGTVFTDLSPMTGKLDIQGPKSRVEMEKALKIRLPDLNYFRFANVMLDGTACMLSRTGYTGEWGYELYCPADEVERFWDLFLDRSEIKPAGLGARDTLRLEVGYPLYGHELSAARTPVAASRGQFMDLKKEFVGKPAVGRDLEKGVPQFLVGLQLESKRAARAQDKVMSGGNVIGEITSGSIAPSLGVAVAMAYVDQAFTQLGRKLEIDAHGTLLPAMVVDLPFYKEGTARKKVGS